MFCLSLQKFSVMKEKLICIILFGKILIFMMKINQQGTQYSIYLQLIQHVLA